MQSFNEPVRKFSHPKDFFNTLDATLVFLYKHYENRQDSKNPSLWNFICQHAEVVWSKEDQKKVIKKSPHKNYIEISVPESLRSKEAEDKLLNEHASLILSMQKESFLILMEMLIKSLNQEGIKELLEYKT